MCGIAGRFHLQALPLDAEWHRRASELLAHRGPDGSGHYSDNFCELVHRRLALIDLSPTGAQPMSNEDGSIQVIFNGEIYNYRVLRKELLARGHVFRGTSDTEVLVHLYEEHGPRLVEYLKGMFAFAIYDQGKRRVLLARDRFGIKPLFYTVSKDQIVFASEIKAIISLSGFVKDIDRQACYDFLGLSYIPEPATGFVGIKMLSKGTVLTFDESGVEIKHYSKLSANPQLKLSINEAIDLIEGGLLDAVASQSIADVPVAALLSGGIDSSLVVAAYCRSATEMPTTFNVSFPEKSYDETKFAVSVARQYGTKHHVIELDQQALSPHLVLRLLSHFDQPFADSSLIPTFQVCKAIRESGVICTMSGDGGDEAFGGYASFWRANQFAKIMLMPRWIQQQFLFAGKMLKGRTPDLGRQLVKAVELSMRGRGSSAFLLAGLSNYLSEEQKQELVRADERASLREIYPLYDGHRPEGTSELEELSRRLTENFFNLGLPSDMLRKVDMMSMHTSIEVRVPMLDEEVVRIGLSLPHRLKTDGRKGKLALRGLAERWLPKSVAAHEKKGFSLPLDRMATPEFHQMLDDMLLSPGAKISSFINVRLVEDWLKMFKRSGQGDYP
ncbi:MAG: asparagine synthase (glutamine-hydrolyzing), partial [Acidobacteriota bacterium]|nr:asparagine synthase (glutamine-hydrolyzing) [Acidobacteriota bacterium]